jgi:DEAD/DEAH box helicase domain-containing protein
VSSAVAAPGTVTGDPTPAAPPAPDLLARLRMFAGPDPIRHVEQIAARPGRTAEWPDWAPAELVTALQRRGITRPWAHQVAVAEAAHAGRHVVVSTGTASGKSLGYQLPVLAGLLADRKACALYLAPTKALAADQLETLESLALAGVRPAAYDGDTPLGDRDWARDHGRWLLTNPDMLHCGVLPAHTRWSRVLRRLAFVVVDECHAYRGVFGSHVALVLRRLRRMARFYGSDPVFVLASATVADPATAASRLIGSPVLAVTDDAAPHPGSDFVLWEPPLLPPGPPDGPTPSTVSADPSSATLPVEQRSPAGKPAPQRRSPAGRADSAGDAPAERQPLRRSAPAEAARILADLVTAGARTLTFVRSRAGAEQTAITARRIVGGSHPELADRVSAYRGGYLPEDRRELERAFDTGELVGVASTNALELGVDIAGIDAAVLAGYPGTLASVWQQAGRAGRGDRKALVVFVARDDPLDSYLVHHPQAVFGRPIEATVTDPANPYILTPHLACAAAENRLTDDDLVLFGGPPARAAVRQLLAEGVLRRRPGGYYLAGHRHPADEVSLRGSGRQVAVVEQTTGRMLGTEDAARACASVHPGAVYLHRGNTYTVTDLDLDEGVALVRADRPDWTTIARSVSTVEILGTDNERVLPGGLRLCTGPVRTTEQVVGYLRRRADGNLIDLVGLDMPELVLQTRAVWYTVPFTVLRSAGIADGAMAGALHAAEHAAIGLLPLFAGCDRWDIGGLSTVAHADTGEPTVIVYDGYPGGAGFAERGFAVAAAWLSAVRDAVRDCGCRSGCPSCVQSPKCGNGNHPLDKKAAVTVLDVVTNALAAAG